MEILKVEVVVEDEDEEDEDNLTMTTMAQADSEETILTGKQITWFKSGKNHQAVALRFLKSGVSLFNFILSLFFFTQTFRGAGVEEGRRGQRRLKGEAVPRVVGAEDLDVGVEEESSTVMLPLAERDQVSVSGTTTTTTRESQSTPNPLSSCHRYIRERCLKKWKIFYSLWLRALVCVSFFILCSSVGIRF